MKNDEWCELCNDKIKSTQIKYLGRTIEVCGHCKALSVGIFEKNGDDRE